MNEIEHLLERYLQDTATEEDMASLMELINTGRYDDVVRKRIGGMLRESSAEDMNAHRAGQMLEAIVSTAREPKMAREVTLQPVRTRVWWLAAAAVIMLAIVAGVMLLTPAGEPTAPAQLAEVMPQPVVLSGKQYVRLPDGSAVLLNDESELRYEPGFATATRDVFLTGEAYFDIKHNPEKPFRVHTGKVITTVLGTAFNVRAWPQAGEVKVTVDRGKVQVGDSSRTYGTITRDQQIAVNTATYDFRQSDVKATLATEWKSTYLILEDISLVDAAALIEARYHIRIQFENEGLKACRVSATFLNDEDIAQVMTVLTTVTGSTYAQQNNSIVLHGPGCGS